MNDMNKTAADNSALPINDNSRREVMKSVGLLGGCALLLSKIDSVLAGVGEKKSDTGEYSLTDARNTLYTVCLQCNTGCGIKVRILDGVAVKIEGNPLSPMTMTPHVAYKSSPFDINKTDGAICPKGQAGIQTLYDPYRIRTVLKRSGPRGSNNWRTIPFDQAINEIVEGGKIFSELGDNRDIEGLRAVRALHDGAVMKAMVKKVKQIQSEKDKEKKNALVDEFKTEFAAHLNTLIDPDHPDLGPKNNQFTFMWGRLKGGRSDLISRFVKDAYGTVNAHGHTTVCQGSLYFTGKAMSYQWGYDEKENAVKWTGEKKFYWQCDTGNSEFIIFVGASPMEANYGPPLRSGKLTNNITSGKAKIVVVDPRFSQTAAKAEKWIPALPGSEGALALALIRWILENNRYDARFLSNANKAAATEDGEPTWCNASWLVKIEKGKPGAFLHGSDLALKPEKRYFTDIKTGEKKTYEFDPFVVIQNGQPVTFDPNSEDKPVEGDLFADTAINGISVKSSLQILAEQAKAHSMDEAAAICGIQAQDIIDLAKEFTSHGKKAAADIHRGVAQHTNGFYNVYAWYSLNLLIGNFDWKGGMVQASTYNYLGEKAGQPYPLKSMHPGKVTPFGIDVIRTGEYEKSTIFKGYPARRNWYPIASDVYEELLPSMSDEYPYPTKVLMMYMAAPTYSLPAGHTNIEVLADHKKIPLIVANDITIGVTSMYADYIFPDTSFLERWEMQGSHPSVTSKIQPVRQPVIAPLTENVNVFGEKMPICLESMLLGIAEKLSLPGFGPNGFGTGIDFNRPEDLYLKMVANLGFGEKEDGSDKVSDADSREMELFLQSRSHLGEAVFDPAKWERACGTEHFRRVMYVLNRGGRFQDYAKSWDGELVKNKYGRLLNLYSEKAAKAKNPFTGKSYSGCATYYPIADISGKPVDDEAQGYNLHMITFREISQCKSRTSMNYWLLGLLPENAILVNSIDARKLGVRSDDRVRVLSASNPEGILDLKNGTKIPLIGKVKVTEGIRPGIIAFSLGFGNWATGSVDMILDGKLIKGDARRGKGVHLNASMRIDPVLKNTCMLDPIGGSVSFYDTKVKLVKV